MNPAGEETVTDAHPAGLPPCDGDEDGRREAGALAQMQRALGVESVYGYHVETPAVPGGRLLRVLSAAPRAAPVPAGGAFPCLDGVQYAGCLGAGCPLETCWTGGATVSYAQRRRAETRVSTALYLPGAPCHECVHVREDIVTVPAPCAAVARRNGRAHPPDEAAPLQLRRVSCERGLWAHPISLSSFLMKRIPMLDEDEPASCPELVERAEPHPEVAAYLRLRRERARERRLEQRGLDAAP